MRSSLKTQKGNRFQHMFHLEMDYFYLQQQVLQFQKNVESFIMEFTGMMQVEMLIQTAVKSLIRQ